VSISSFSQKTGNPTSHAKSQALFSSRTPNTLVILIRLVEPDSSEPVISSTMNTLKNSNNHRQQRNVIGRSAGQPTIKRKDQPPQKNPNTQITILFGDSQTTGGGERKERSTAPAHPPNVQYIQDRTYTREAVHHQTSPRVLPLVQRSFVPTSDNQTHQCQKPGSQSN